MKFTRGAAAAILVVVSALSGASPRVFSSCELAHELYTRQGMAWRLIPDFVCIAEHVSELNSSWVRDYGFNSVRYGLFRIHNEHFCRDEFGTRNLCHTNCSELLGDDITKSVKCALQIYSDFGFTHWTTWTTYCEGHGHDLRHHLRQCEVVDGQTPPRVTASSAERNQTLVLDAEDQFLECEVSGIPAPELYWHYNMTEFPELIAMGTENIGPSTWVSRLLFPKVEWRHEGRFSCFAESLAGEATGEFTVNVGKESGSNETGRSGLFYALSIGIPTVAAFLLITGAVHVLRKKRRSSAAIVATSEYSKAPDKLSRTFAEFELSEEQVIIHENVTRGTGRFGRVCTGTMVASGETVAVKTVPTNWDGAGDNQICIEALLCELKILVKLLGDNHPNIVNLIGARTSQLDFGEMLLFVEYCELGDLECYLRKRKESFLDCTGGTCANARRLSCETTAGEHYWTTTQVARLNPIGTCDLLRWSAQIACAMEFLASKNVVHGDLATRNVLLMDRQRVKVTDFGLAKNLYAKMYYTRNQEGGGEAWPLPWRSLAIESLLEMNFSLQSDVWSFGVTLWEIFTLGEVPYTAGTICSTEFVTLLKEGVRLPKPQHAPPELYAQMLRCWALHQGDRPRIWELKKLLVEMETGCPR